MQVHHIAVACDGEAGHSRVKLHETGATAVDRELVQSACAIEVQVDHIAIACDADPEHVNVKLGPGSRVGRQTVEVADRCQIVRRPIQTNTG